MMKRITLLLVGALHLSGFAQTTDKNMNPQGTRHVRLLHIADTHAQLETHPEFMPGSAEFPMMGGFARLKTAIEKARRESPSASFLLDSGDAFQGSGPAAWSEGEAILAPLNGLGLDAFVPGNWEVVYGPDRFKDLMRRINASVIAYNFHDSDTGKRLFAPAAILERNGVKVAFVGIADPTTTKRQPPAQVKGLDSTRMENFREFVQKLRREQRPDLIVAVTHTGLTVSRQIAREAPELDVILSGHTHERTEASLVEGKTIIVEPGSMGSFLGVLDLEIKPGGGVEKHSFKLLPVTAREYPENKEMSALVNAALAPYRSRMNKAVAHAKGALLRYDVLQTTTDNFIADAVRNVTKTDIAFSNGFRFGPPILPGDVKEGDLWTMLPLDTRIKVGWVTGKQLRDYLESELELVFSDDPWKLSGGWGPRASGLEMTYYANRPPGHRVVSVKIGGKEIRDDAKYSMAGCEREGESLDFVCRMPGVHDVEVKGASVHEALLAFLKTHPTITTARDHRVKVLDLPEQVLSQDEILQTRRENSKIN